MIKILKLLSLINIFNNNIIIYSGSGFGFGSHSKELYFYLKKNIKDKDIYVVSRKKDPNCYYLYSLKGIILLLFSKYIFLNVTLPKFISFKNKIIIQLWHGVPLKSLGYFDNSISDELKKRLKFEFNNYNYIIATSEYQKLSLINSFKIKNTERIIISTTPEILHLKYKIDNLSNKNENQKINILYLPTYRTSNNNIDRSWDLNEIIGIDKFIEENNISFKTSYHPLDPLYEKKSIEQYYSDFSESDIIISDYSSIIFDCLTLNKKFCLYCTDKENYISERGINPSFNFSEFPIIHNLDDLGLFIMNNSFDFDKLSFYKSETDEIVFQSILKMILK
ncbi:CDP-glycerol glycerophosphotransferase family protein [Providencia huaxiensis]|uniref:CDP-glycerol glycerophosphotransferase family protein n=1 Tax=Providencia TaxID=586 RepID=UPI0030101A8A